MFYNSDNLDKISLNNDTKSLMDLIDSFEIEEDRLLNINLIIQNLCKKGNLLLIKDVLSKYYNNFRLCNSSFKYSCKSGNLELVKYLLQLDKLNINELINNIDSSFQNSCLSGNLELVTFLLDLFPNINISKYDELSFQSACLSRNIGLVKYLLLIKPNIDIYAYNNEAIKNACYSGSIEIVKYLFNLSNNNFYKTNSTLKRILICATQSCNLELFKYLLNKFKNLNNYNIDLSFNNETLFITACNSRNNELVKYLLEIKPDIDIHTKNSIKGKDYCFKLVCAKENMELVELLYRKNPYLIYKYSNLFTFLEELLDTKTRLIQNWWKEKLYNPHTERGRNFINNQIEWAF
tara:strand:- start:644 stop:1693 length:1050 start_codon:yes stop_codon:yes gene_type:complete